MNGSIISVICNPIDSQWEQLISYITSEGYLKVYDLRSHKQIVNQFIGGEYGSLTCIAHGSKFYSVLVGTNKGFIHVYDIRFDLITQWFQYGTIASIINMKPIHHFV